MSGRLAGSGVARVAAGGALGCGSPLPGFLPRRVPWGHSSARRCAGVSRPAAAFAALSTDKTPESEQQLPRFYSDAPLKAVGIGMTLVLSADEGRHAKKVLRLKPGAAVELCDGEGRLARAQLLDGTREAAVVTTTAASTVPWIGPRWIVAAACGSLKGGRGDWLVEKCSELGAEALLPLLTERSPAVGRGDAEETDGGGRPGRWDRIAQASSKQCLRTHKLRVLAPAPVARLSELIGTTPGVALLATQGGAPLHEVLNGVDGGMARAAGGLLIIGPEGDFTPAEKAAVVSAGARGIGLGVLRLRVETAAIALLSAVSLWQPPVDYVVRQSELGR